jgi:hypothetical protein
MTNIDKIKQARQDLDEALGSLRTMIDRDRPARDLFLAYEVVNNAEKRLSYAQAEALRQATEVADENFARAQKLSEQVQENVRHIERLAAIKVSADPKLLEIVEEVFVIGERLVSDVYGYEFKEKALAALALAKGEAV